MSGRIFQNVVLQLKENTDRTVGVIDGDQKKKNIRINHLISGTWILGAKTQELLDDNIQLWETLVQTVSRMANAFVVVLSEMDNSQNANKLLGQNVGPLALRHVFTADTAE